MRILLTGSTGKVGQCLAHSLWSKNARLVLHTWKNEAMARALPGEVMVADFSRIEEVKRVAASAAKTLSGLDAVIHAASGFEPKAFGDISEEDWHQTLDVDLKAAFFLAQEAVKHMPDGGKLIFFSDVAADRVYKNYLPYSIAKAGVNALTKGLAKILPPSFTVNAIAPYRIGEGEGETPPEAVAGMVWDLLTGKKKGTGYILTVNS